MFLCEPKQILTEYFLFYIFPEGAQTTVRQAAAVLAKNTVEEMKSGKQIRHPFQELPVLPEDYGNDDDEEDGGETEIPQKLIDESQMLDMDEGDDGEYLPEQMQDGKIKF